jgi:hypothetical protein
VISTLEQSEFLAPSPPPVVVELVEGLLDEKARWLHVAELAETTGINERVVRQVASVSAKIISSPALGYKHVKHSTPAEIAHFKNTQRSRIREMARRLIAVQRYAHSIFG